MPEIVAFFVACVALLILSGVTAKAYGRGDAVILSLCLCASWAASKMIAHGGSVCQVFNPVGDWAAARQAYPAIDAVIVSAAGALCLEKPELWKIAFVSTVAAKLTVDLMYAFSPFGGDYQVVMNAGFGMEIACVAVPGGLVVANHYRRPRIAGRRRRARPLPPRVHEV